MTGRTYRKRHSKVHSRNPWEGQHRDRYKKVEPRVSVPRTRLAEPTKTIWKPPRAYRNPRLDVTFLDKEGNSKSLSVPIKILSLTAENVLDEKSLIKRDMLTGKRISRRSLILENEVWVPSTGGVKYGLIDEDGDVLLGDNNNPITENQLLKEGRLGYFELNEEGVEVQISPGDTNVVKDMPLEILDKRLDIKQADEYLFDKTYEIVADAPVNIPQLYELAEALEDNETALIARIQWQKGFNEKWGVITPFFDRKKGVWTLLMRTTQTKITPKAPMPEPRYLEIPEPKKTRKRAKRAKKQATLF